MLEDIKPVIPPSPTPVMVEPRAIGLPPQQPSELHEENMQLRYRVSLLEGIVKQTAAYFSNNTPIDMHMVTPPPTHVMNRTHRSPHPGMDATLSPPMFPTHHREPVHSPLRLQTQLDNSVPTQPTNAPVDVSSFVDLSTPVARHPAAVATSVAVSSPERRRAQALQRARGSLTEFNLDVPANRQRLATVARLVVALARLRGLTSTSATRSSRLPPRSKLASRRRTVGSLRALRRFSGTRK